MNYFNKMLILPVVCLLLSAAHAEEETSLQPVTNRFWYFDIGVGPLPFLLPQFGIGYRAQKDHKGINIGGTISTIGFVTITKFNVNYVHYFTPNLSKQVYFAIGPTVACVSPKGLLCGPNVILGKEFLSDTGGRRFLEMDVTWPSYYAHHNSVIYFPLVSISYGFCF